MNHRPLLTRRYFGQHWLVEESILSKIINAAKIIPTDRILEIGPGKGYLTEKLIRSNPALLLSIEIDKYLIPNLRKRFSNYSNFKLIEGDFLTFPLTPPEGIFTNKVVANIPYNITGPILDKLVGRLGRPSVITFDSLVLLVQKEVADRILSPPGSSSFSALSIRMQLQAECTEVCKVEPFNFVPPPKVDSKVILIKPLKKDQRLSIEIENNIERIITVAFMQRRKKLRNTLNELYRVDLLEKLSHDIGITLDQRPQELNIQNWVALAKGIDLKSAK
ncbi:16S rRNA (adenine(1518)-N(6)/adenine(1519)-N(6))-dimethyltransferase RsmA [Prochlorococcus sp. MIT 1223]|uniref:16S rRNA (adenine(1518)-N(6)/adenine(1519)-N(6))- dimethyltransferase RsmA n=1 Tax=Prochlorococcus sp. MIT 1223 TaxID=3096217 RepID=UPI002A74D3B3|nr:16S rRNA (adenine(1518)-N(6)/adenine(1519)-N(6))-dimethyltransferase RsmA [Prochlorococcus sp. MIT 1223]